MLTTNNDSTKRLEQGDIRKLADCDTVMGYSECGWYCLLGHKDGRRVVHAHAESLKTVQLQAVAAGYEWDGSGMREVGPERQIELMRELAGSGAIDPRYGVPFR